jgi:hypothetical protein
MCSGGAVDGEQLGQAMQNIVGVQLARHDDGEALAGKLINDRQHAKRPAVLRLVLDEIIAPDVAGALKRTFIVSDKRSRPEDGCTSRHSARGGRVSVVFAAL